MRKKERNYAFIDSQNVNLGIMDLGWKLDWRRFRVYLKEKYGVSTAYLFIGFLEENQDLYDSLQKSGYVLIFKELLEYRDGTVKGNCDAELVLQAMLDYKEYDKAVIISGDGDFTCLVKYLNKNKKLKRVLAPNIKEYSALLKRAAEKHLDFMNSLRKKLEYKQRKYKKKSKQISGEKKVFKRLVNKKKTRKNRYIKKRTP